MVANGDIDSKTANTIIYGCNSILESIRVDDQQRKLEKLEALVNSMRR